MPLNKLPTELYRTFSIVQKHQDEEVGVDWRDYINLAKEKTTWNHLLDKPIVVVLGEAGIGKTVEFELEVKRLKLSGKPAFFVALNQLVDSESWERTLIESFDDYKRWKASTETGYFFLDAVDEARLNGQDAFERALSVVFKVLNGHMSRVHFVLSSRPTDWSIDGVRSAVHKYLANPIATASSSLKETPVFEIGRDNTKGTPTVEVIEPLVFSLDPLSISEAKKLSEAYHVNDIDAFWDKVSDGGYEFMATRPLDLGWMVRLWNENKSFGTYIELIASNINNRLTEVNPSYISAEVVLSPRQLREGAEMLAAAAEFSGRTYISIEYPPTDKLTEVNPFSALSSWKPNEVKLLLATAIFDESTFGRVRFHHRKIREYLAASWVNRQLNVGVPFHRILTLFVRSPFGTNVLIPSRRWAFCWLAAINVDAREWLTLHFPEMFLFDGDPDAWDSLSADRAFKNYVQRLNSGLNIDWYNDKSEFRRIGRKLSTGLIKNILTKPELSSQAKIALFPLIKHGQLFDCAEAIFYFYKCIDNSERERLYALNVLKTIATPEQRKTIEAELISGSLTSNALIASALLTVDWQMLTVTQITAIFEATQSEGGFGAGPMARALKQEMLPLTNVTSAEMLLRAVLKILPKPKSGLRFARFPESDQPELAWLIDVLPDCFERLLTLLPKTNKNYPDIYIEAAERIVALQDTGFIDNDDLIRLHALITGHSELRWQIALEIALSENITYSTSRLVWGMDCLVNFTAKDISQLIMRANDVAVSQEVSNVWFTVGMDVIFQGLRGRARTEALNALVSALDNQERRSRIDILRTEKIEGSKQRREWKKKEFVRKHTQKIQHETNRNQLLVNVEHISDASNKNAIIRLIRYSWEHAGRDNLRHVDYDLITRDFDQTVADALSTGLKSVWNRTVVQNPVDYSDGTIPWDVLIALAGFNTLLDEGMDIESLSYAEAVHAAKLAVWEMNGPPNWFEPLFKAHTLAVIAALGSWIESGAQMITDSYRLQSSLKMVLRCSTEVISVLLKPLVPMVLDGRINHPQILKDVVKALSVVKLLSPDDFVNLCRTHVVASIESQGLICEMHWLRTWLEEDAVSAMEWFDIYVASKPTEAGELVIEFAKMAHDCSWIKKPLDAVSIGVLLRLHRLLTQHQPLPNAPIDTQHIGTFDHVVSELRLKIPNLLVQSRGEAAHRALVELMETETDYNAKQWLANQIMEQAAIEALDHSKIETCDLFKISSPFISDPKSEAQLFEQVIARLEEVRIGTEEGPFSDRGLFSPKTPEKHLQIWLAARFLETQNRRFSVTREEEVDNNKEPDIQFGCPQGKVCVEIKPVSREHSYSAKSLTDDTLQRQLVGQYLKGFNSAHGILVLFRLDDKTWDIPGRGKKQSFNELVEYLQSQAKIIMAESPEVKALRVFGIDCVALNSNPINLP